MRQSHLGKTHPPEVRAKIAGALTALPKSPEHRQRMSEVRGDGRLRGAGNGRWQGGRYTHFHDAIRKARGTPKHCERCGQNDPTKRYDWANLTGNYADTNDYARMCRSCHKKYDIARAKGKAVRWLVDSDRVLPGETVG